MLFWVALSAQSQGPLTRRRVVFPSIQRRTDKNLQSLQNFCCTFRFIDDLITMSNETYGKNIQNIYPAVPERKTENKINKSAI